MVDEVRAMPSARAATPSEPSPTVSGKAGIAIAEAMRLQVTYAYMPMAARRALQAGADALDAKDAALRQFIYETTSLSPMEVDGSHWCKISAACLEEGRRALARGGK